MNCPEDKPCVWIKDGQDCICGNCGHTKPKEGLHREIRRAINRSVEAIEWGGMDK